MVTAGLPSAGYPRTPLIVPLLAGCVVLPVEGTLVAAGVFVAAATVGMGGSLGDELGVAARGPQAAVATVTTPSNLALMIDRISGCLPLALQRHALHERRRGGALVRKRAFAI
jgi:hypothetical protein